VLGEKSGSGKPAKQTDSNPAAQVTPVPARPAPAAGSTLPFTGADLGAVVLAALILLLLGAALRRSTREQS
jgi:hypothetical protein